MLHSLSMEITFLGHSSFKIKTRSATVVTDPFNNTIGIKFPSVTADIVTVSHNHDDHNNTTGVDEARRVIDGPGEYEIGGVSIIGLSAFHDDKDGEARGPNTIYIFEAEGLRLVHFGDLGHALSEKFYEKLGDIDVAFVPVGGVYTIGSQVASEIIKTLEPTICIPMHFADSGLSKEAFGELEDVAKFTTALGVAATTDTKLIVNQANLGEEQKVVVLQRKG